MRRAVDFNMVESNSPPLTCKHSFLFEGITRLAVDANVFCSVFGGPFWRRIPMNVFSKFFPDLVEIIALYDVDTIQLKEDQIFSAKNEGYEIYNSRDVGDAYKYHRPLTAAELLLVETLGGISHFSK